MSIKVLYNQKKDGINKISPGIKLVPITPNTQQKVRLEYRSTNNQHNLPNNIKKQTTSEAPISHGIKKLRELKNSQNENKSTDKLKINRSAYSSNKLKINSTKIPLNEYISHNKSVINYTRDSNSSNFPVILTKEKDFFREIATLWQELAVTENYRKAFEEITEQLDIFNRNGYYEFELNQLTKSKEIIIKVSDEIIAREKAIELFSYIEIYIRRNENEKSVIDNILSTIQSIRVLSINIINHFLKLRKICSFDILNGKYDLGQLQSNFKVDFNYLIKMNNDTDFLANSSISRYFTFSNDADPFFISCTYARPDTNKQGSDNEKKKIQIEANVLSSIRTCQYYITQELSYSEMNRIANDSSKYISSVSSHNRNLPSAKSYLKNFPNQSNPSLHSNLNANSNQYINSKSPNNRNFFLNTAKPRKLEKLDEGLMNVSKIENIPMRIFSAKSREKLIKEKLNDISGINTNLTPAHMKSNNEKVSSVMKMKKIKIHIEHEAKEKHELKSEEIPRFDKRRSEESILFDVATNNIDKNNEANDKLELGLNENEKINQMIKKIDDALKISQTFEKSEHLEILIKEEKIIKSTLEVEKLVENTQEEEKKDSNINDNFNNLINDHLIIPDVEIKEEIKIENIRFELLKGNINQYQTIYKEYISNLNDEQKIIFKINPDLTFYIKGNFPKIIKFSYDANNSSNMCGIAAINYDSMTEIIKLVISHFSTVYYNLYNEIFKKFISYLQETFHFKEIYLELHYGNNKNINIAYLTDIISKKNKFRWIALENTEEGRKTKYRYINPEYVDDIAAEDSIKKDPRDIFSLITCIVANAKENDQIKNNKSYTEDEYDVCLFPVTCLLSHMIYSHDFESDNDLMKKFKHNSLMKYQKMIKCIGSSASDVEEFLFENLKGKDNMIKEIKSYLSDEDQLYSVIMKINLRFENVLTVRMKDLTFNRIQTDSIDILEHPDDNHKFYLIKTADSNISVVISQIEENSRLKSLIDNKSNENLTALFFELYSNLVQTSSNDTKNIFIPTFKLNQSKKLYNPKSINEIEMQYDGEDFAIEKFFYHNALSLQSDNYSNSNDICIDYNASEDILINKDYIISVINSDILTDMNIPIISVTIIKESDFHR